MSPVVRAARTACTPRLCRRITHRRRAKRTFHVDEKSRRDEQKNPSLRNMREIKREFVSEPLTPDAGSGSLAAMAQGEPGLPRAFTWRGTRYELARVDATWKGHGEDRGDTYVRKHWYDIVTTSGLRLRVYFDRNPGRGGSQRSRWWVYSVEGEI